MSLIKYVCFIENCGESFENDSDIKFHLRKIHALKANGHYECCVPFCFKNFSAFKNFSKHLKTHNMEDVVVTNPVVNGSTDISVALDVSSNEINVIPSTSNEMNVIPSTSNIENDLHHIEKINLNVNENSREKHIEDNVVFTTKYLSKNNITRSDVQNLQSDIQTFITSHIGNMIKINILEKMKSKSISNREIMSALEEILEICEDPFKNIDSEYKFFKFMVTNELLRKPTDFIFNEIIAPKIVNYENTLGVTSSHVNIQDLTFQFRKFFELPGMLKETLEHMTDLEKNPDIVNFISGSLFKTIKATYAPNDVVIPFFLYWDDFEINNPLGLFN